MNVLNWLRRGSGRTSFRCEHFHPLEKPDLEQTCKQVNLCYWASRDVPYTQIRFLSVWEEKHSDDAYVGLKVLSTQGARYWIFARVKQAHCRDRDVLWSILQPVFSRNGWEGVRLFAGLPSILSVDDDAVLSVADVKCLVMMLMQFWSGADVRSFNHVLMTSSTDEQALKTRLGQDLMRGWDFAEATTEAPEVRDLEAWWAIVSDPRRVRHELQLVCHVDSHWHSIQRWDH